MNEIKYVLQEFYVKLVNIQTTTKGVVILSIEPGIRELNIKQCIKIVVSNKYQRHT